MFNIAHHHANAITNEMFDANISTKKKHPHLLKACFPYKKIYVFECADMFHLHTYVYTGDRRSYVGRGGTLFQFFQGSQIAMQDLWINPWLVALVRNIF